MNETKFSSIECHGTKYWLLESSVILMNQNYTIGQHDGTVDLPV